MRLVYINLCTGAESVNLTPFLVFTTCKGGTDDADEKDNYKKQSNEFFHDVFLLAALIMHTSLFSGGKTISVKNRSGEYAVLGPFLYFCRVSVITTGKTNICGNGGGPFIPVSVRLLTVFTNNIIYIYCFCFYRSIRCMPVIMAACSQGSTNNSNQKNDRQYKGNGLLHVIFLLLLYENDHLANANGQKESGSINGTGCANAVSPWGSAQNHKSWNKDCWRHHHRYSINTCSSAHTYNANAYADWRA